MERANRRHEESQRRRERILEAARLRFGEDGYSGTTIGAIAKGAGVSNGLLYQFFQGKEDLFRVVMADITRDWVRAIVPRDEEGLSPTQKLEALFHRSVDFCRTHPLLPAILTGDALSQMARAGNPNLERLGAHRQLIASMLQDGIRAGEFRSDLDVESLADIIQQLHIDYSTRAYRKEKNYPFHPELIEAVSRFIHEAVRATPAP